MAKVDLSVYGIIDPAVTGREDITERVLAAAAGGMTLLQYRYKDADTATMVADGRMLRALHVTCPLLINDRVDVALAVGADGVHIGQSDMSPTDARRLLGPDAIIGLTIKTADDVANAPIDLIDYACIGGVFKTTSKNNPDPPVGLNGLRNLADKLRARGARFPIGAIAGITADNAGAVISAGVDGVAVISEIFVKPDVTAATRVLGAVVSEALKERVEGDLS
ncbi:MAG: thiamine phosphate synthase [Pseudomonadota bacterium]